MGPLWVWLYCLIGFVLLLFSIVLFSTIRIVLTLEKKQDDAWRVNFGVRVHGHLFAIPLPDGQKAEHPKKDKTKRQPEQKEDIQVFALLQKGYHLFRKLEYTMLMSREGIRKRLVLEKLDLDLKFGLGDAAETGIATGVAWGLLYNIYAQLDRFVTVENHGFQLTPVFNSRGFQVLFSGVLRFRLIDTIVISLMVLYHFLMVNQKYKKAV